MSLEICYLEPEMWVPKPSQKSVSWLVMWGRGGREVGSPGGNNTYLPSFLPFLMESKGNSTCVKKKAGRYGEKLLALMRSRR